MKKDALFCVGQKAFIEKDGKVLVLFDSLGLDFPGGKIQEGEAIMGRPESLSGSLKREVLEETSFEIEVGQPFAVWYTEFPEGSRNFGKVVYIVGFRCRYISGELTLSDEHQSFKWVDKDTYKELEDLGDFSDDYFGALRKYFETK